MQNSCRTGCPVTSRVNGKTAIGLVSLWAGCQAGLMGGVPIGLMAGRRTQRVCRTEGRIANLKPGEYLKKGGGWDGLSPEQM